MKKIVFVFCCILLFSCKTQKTTLAPFVAIYKSSWVGNIQPEYILLKMQPKVFETYSPIGYASTIGQWSVNNDTLFLFPQYECLTRNHELKFLEILPNDSSIVSTPQQYLMKDDCLINITDYNIILPKIFDNQNNKAVYRRVNK